MTSLLSGAVITTIQLVGVATLLAIVLGVLVGVVSALRQYTGFDYSITFLSFLLYSLPVFWVAVLAKVFLAISFNDFLADPHISVPVIVGSALLVGIVVSSAVGRIDTLETAQLRRRCRGGRSAAHLLQRSPTGSRTPRSASC